MITFDFALKNNHYDMGKCKGRPFDSEKGGGGGWQIGRDKLFIFSMSTTG